jgi:hypothetical protein
VHILRAIYKTAITVNIHHESAPRSSDTAVSAGAPCYPEAQRDNLPLPKEDLGASELQRTPAATHGIRIPRSPRSKSFAACPLGLPNPEPFTVTSRQVRPRPRVLKQPASTRFSCRMEAALATERTSVNPVPGEAGRLFCRQNVNAAVGRAKDATIGDLLVLSSLRMLALEKHTKLWSRSTDLVSPPN